MKFECEQCEYSTDNERGLKIHIGRVHGKPEVECDGCGTVFKTSPSVERRFCSDGCYRKWRQKKSQKKVAECETCSEEFEYHPAAEKGVFCSIECYSKSDIFPNGQDHWRYVEREERGCDGCGDLFLVTPNHRSQRFCSHQCALKNSDWEKPGRNMVDRIEIECFECGKRFLRLPSNVTSDEGRAFCSSKCRGAWVSKSDVFKTDPIFVEETNTIVASGWEADIDRLLGSSDFSYEYEGRTFQIGEDRNYTPDFIVEDDIIVEVKGQPSKSSFERAELFMRDYGEEYLYIVVGKQTECDIHIPWRDREDTIKVIENAV